jgi:hypothetical protein
MPQGNNGRGKETMRIKNIDNMERAAFVYNKKDTSRAIALASTSIKPNEWWDYFPPRNETGMYTVLIHHDPGGGLIMAIGSASGDTRSGLVFDGNTLSSYDTNDDLGRQAG